MFFHDVATNEVQKNISKSSSHTAFRLRLIGGHWKAFQHSVLNYFLAIIHSTLPEIFSKSVDFRIHLLTVKIQTAISWTQIWFTPCLVFQKNSTFVWLLVHSHSSTFLLGYILTFYLITWSYFYSNPVIVWHSVQHVRHPRPAVAG